MRNGISIPDEEYFKNPAISASLLKKMDCPAKAFVPFTSTAMVEGSMIHCAVLEPSEFDSRYIVAPVINKRTNAGKAEWAEFQEANADKTVITPDQHSMSMKVQKAVYGHPMASELLSGGKAEQSFFWKDKKTGEDMKCKADYVSDVVIDLKTCISASPGAFSKACADYKYGLQAVHYLRGTGAKEFIFIAVEKKFPFVVEVYKLDSDSMEYSERKLDEALQSYIFCRDFDIWPGYNDRQSVTSLSLPAWSMKD